MMLVQKTVFMALFLGGMISNASPASALTLAPVGSYPENPLPDWFDDGGAEAIGYDEQTQTILVTNRATRSVHVVSIANPSTPALVAELDVTPYGFEPTNLDVKDGLLAVTVSAEEVTDNGVVLLIDVAGIGLLEPQVVEVGALPDAVKFTPDARRLVVLNEGEPNDRYTVDPEGSISIIDLRSMRVRTAGFARFNADRARLIRRGIRIFGPDASVAQDLEPENLTISEDSSTAWITLQENNAFAVVDLCRARVIRLVPLGYKPHLFPRNPLDASDKDDGIHIRTWPVFGMYLPDGIASFQVHGASYLITANEGDARDYVYEDENGEEVVAFSEEARVKDLQLTPVYEQFWPGLQESENLGRLKTTTSPPRGKLTTAEGEEVYTQIFSYGARSFSIWRGDGRQIYDSGAELEQIIAELAPETFNANNDDNDADSRSDDKGPEPEGVVVGQVGGVLYGFITLERVGGIMVYDLTRPNHPSFATYVNHRDFDGEPSDGEAGDLAPEGMAFIAADKSPNGVPLLAVANEVSGNATIFEILSD